METARPAPSNFGSLAKTVTKILRLRRAATGSGGGGGVGVASDKYKPIMEKLKLSGNLTEYSTMLSEPHKDEDGKQQQEHSQKLSSKDKEAMESLLANLFASISAIKAAYAQLQVAQSPYDPDSIQSADKSVVSELKHLSVLKQCYLKNQLQSHAPPASQSALEAQIQEHRSLLRTYQITTKKLEAEIQLKDSEILSLQAELLSSEKQNRALDARLHPGRSLAALDDLHLSGLNPTHFLTALRYAVKSIRSFVQLMVREMESAGWDLDAAAGSIQPDVLRRKPRHRIFAFESFVCQKMFSDFHRRDFNLSSSADRSAWDQRRFFKEFTDLQFVSLKQAFDGKGQKSALGKFLRAKYLALVHPKMEASFFGDLDQRALVSSGRGFPESAFFAGFAEMARRVWLLHCLFFSFGPEEEGSIFQARRGTRFSEVYMESIAEDDDDDDDTAGVRPPAVGFTVVPGFRVGKTLIQCKVYLSSRVGGRS
ncbi:protein GRAVITROPIC IN THE LIGHT 1 [Phoenix dactylifera]|uniref:Protein GRAVITROPIC IN THE LIGHT 1 n=1 Tax=Phoenix dactylifera TaxID=42345 RepID=A0A8B9AFH3_PHODC|nr:protein GRAVITROPIC IN THE LIGHT 1 [Phoenix dactylifera]XP_008790033.1 protein GRAVITROPIC IN THE LIGHT 1 [Phoenix dactylifera]XP_038985129.1 protein GRAVITROPIC IN THE LIGHT 1 [Phoenix dactylifera]XP_038985130.1 protein GRAVITROPIC IN THE LIGHT 1 [Phoenix dactylifera]XP_038985131.1 protein GRAVITROPIC IN THE LIGHT 1 [Phoenix dactylifera]